MTEQELKQQMMREMAEKEIFSQVRDYAFEYANSIINRNIFPTEEALSSMQIFNDNETLYLADLRIYRNAFSYALFSSIFLSRFLFKQHKF